MIWDIEPQMAIGPLSLGMTQAECVALLGNEFDAFKRTPHADEITLAFDSEHVHVAIDSQQTVTSISVFRPRRVTLNGVQILDEDLSTVVNGLQSTGLEMVQVDAGAWCRDAGVVLVRVDERVDGVELTASGD